MKKEDIIDPNIEINRNMASLALRTPHIIREDALIENAFASREIFWEDEKKKFDKIMASLRGDSGDVKRKLSENIVYSERLIVDFRNRVKQDKVDLLKSNIESWNLDEFITKKRFNELLSIEIKSYNKRRL